MSVPADGAIDLSDESDDGSSLFTVTVYVLSEPSSAVTVIPNTFSPTESSFAPAPESVESASFTTALSVMLVTAYGTLTMYEVSSGSNALSHSPVFVVRDFKLLSIEAFCLVTVTV